MTRDRGSADVLGLVLIAPAMIGLALLVLWLGRRVDAEAQVRMASQAAAQAAARQRDATAAADAATRTAELMLTDVTACATGALVGVDTSNWRAGGTVSVTVTCTPATADLRPAAATHPSAITAVAAASLDTYRAGALP